MTVCRLLLVLLLLPALAGCAQVERDREIASELAAARKELQAGDRAAARQRLGALLDAHPKRPDLPPAVIGLYRSAYDPDGLSVFLESYRRSGLADGEGQRLMLRAWEAELAGQQGDWDTAIERAETLLQEQPDDPLRKNLLAYLLAQADRDLDRAFALAMSAAGSVSREEQPEAWAEYQDTLAWVEYRQGAYSRARRRLEQAAGVLAQDEEVRYHLGRAFLKEAERASDPAERDRKREAGRRELTRSARINPLYPEPRRALAELAGPVGGRRAPPPAPGPARPGSR